MGNGNAKYMGEEPVEGTPFRKLKYDIYNDGACQCYGDCDCYKEKGKLMGRDERFKHPLATRSFPSLHACQESYNHHLKKPRV